MNLDITFIFYNLFWICIVQFTSPSSPLGARLQNSKQNPPHHSHQKAVERWPRSVGRCFEDTWFHFAHNGHLDIAFDTGVWDNDSPFPLKRLGVETCSGDQTLFRQPHRSENCREDQGFLGAVRYRCWNRHRSGSRRSCKRLSGRTHSWREWQLGEHSVPSLIVCKMQSRTLCRSLPCRICLQNADVW